MHGKWDRRKYSTLIIVVTQRKGYGHHNTTVKGSYLHLRQNFNFFLFLFVLSASYFVIHFLK